MKRPAVLVLLLTFVALVAATLWVPAWAMTSPPGGQFWAEGWQVRWVGDVRSSPLTLDELTAIGVFDEVDIAWIQWPPLIAEYVLILAIGGLLALALHLRERRRAGSLESSHLTPETVVP